MNNIIEIQKFKRKDTYILFPLSLPLFFVLYHLVKLEIQEHFIYGQIEEGIVKKIEFSESTTGRVGSLKVLYLEFYIKTLSDDSLIKVREKKQKLDEINFPRDADFQQFKEGDKVTVKILNSYTVKILTYNGVEVNKYNNFLTSSFWWLLLLAMLFLAILPYYVFFTRKKRIKQEEEK